MSLHPQLEKDTHLLGQMALSRVLLMNDVRYPWVILVPQRAQLREWIDLPPEERVQLLEESCRVQRALQEIFRPDKLNIGALGNIVPQLHLHHIARYQDDPAWPAPVWGHSPAVPYRAAVLRERSEQLIEQLSLSGNP